MLFLSTMFFRMLSITLSWVRRLIIGISVLNIFSVMRKTFQKDRNCKFHLQLTVQTFHYVENFMMHGLLHLIFSLNLILLNANPELLTTIFMLLNVNLKLPEMKISC